MKTITKIKALIKDNLAELEVPGVVITKRAQNAIIRKDKFLKEILMYLETNPKLEFLNKEKERLSTLIIAKESQFERWSKNICDKSLEVSKRKSTFDRELGIKNLKNQLKTINFILQ